VADLSQFAASDWSSADGEIEQFRDAVGRFLDRRADADRQERWHQAGVVDRAFWREAGDMGLLCPSLPVEYGGAGTDFRYDAVVAEELGRRGLEGFGAVVHSMIAAPYLLEFAQPAERAHWLADAARGDAVLAIAMTEPDAGSDLRGIRTTASPDGDGFRISGQKTFISNGQTADIIIVACRTGGDGGRGELSLLVVEPAVSQGFSRGRNLKKIGRDAQDTSELYFDNVFVPGRNLLGGTPGEGFDQLSLMLPQERLSIAIMGQALMERAFGLTLEHAKTRRLFGKSLWDFQNTKFKLADLRCRIAASRSFLDAGINRHLQGGLSAPDAAMIKLFVTETEWAVVDDCLQLFGGYGYMDEYPIAKIFRDSRIDRIHGGSSEVMKIVIAKSL